MKKIDLKELKFDENGLIPAVVVDFSTKKVLTLAYMNLESLKITLKEGKTCFYSRSRKTLWRKGEISGNFQHVVAIKADCDRDALEVIVRKDGPACHKGTDSCFDHCFVYGDSNAEFTLVKLLELIKGRRDNRQEGSYTSYLFDKGIDKILKKVGEESTEVVIAAKANDRKETVYEIADLVYHVLVLMAEMNISCDYIIDELALRHIIDHKVKQEKMTH